MNCNYSYLQGKKKKRVNFVPNGFPTLNKTANIAVNEIAPMAKNLENTIILICSVYMKCSLMVTSKNNCFILYTGGPLKFSNMFFC